jgi:hypothetical protein
VFCKSLVVLLVSSNSSSILWQQHPSRVTDIKIMWCIGTIHIKHCIYGILLNYGCLLFNYISCRSVLMVPTRISGGKHKPVTDKYYHLQFYRIYLTAGAIRSHNFSSDKASKYGKLKISYRIRTMLHNIKIYWGKSYGQWTIILKDIRYKIIYQTRWIEFSVVYLFFFLFIPRWYFLVRCFSWKLGFQDIYQFASISVDVVDSQIQTIYQAVDVV